jgi:hypothetical protein
VKVQTEEESSQETEQYPQPGEHQVELGEVRLHIVRFDLSPAKIPGRPFGALIDKTAGRID